MKTINPANYRLVRAVAEGWARDAHPGSHVVVFFEHGHFWAHVHDGDKLSVYGVVDAVCEHCAPDGVDYCFNCGRLNGIGFELLQTVED